MQRSSLTIFPLALRALSAVTLAIAIALPVCHAADPQAYTVTLNDTGNAALDQALKDSSTLISLNQSAPVGPFALVARAQKDLERFAILGQLWALQRQGAGAYRR